VSAQQFEAMVSRLAARLKEDPEDPEGWMMLGRSYAVLGRFGEASEAYANAAARTPGDAQLLADYADALAMAQGRTLQGEPEKILLRALAIDPNNVKALLLAGTAAFNRNDGTAAVRHWERVLGSSRRSPTWFKGCRQASRRRARWAALRAPKRRLQDLPRHPAAPG